MRRPIVQTTYPPIANFEPKDTVRQKLKAWQWNPICQRKNQIILLPSRTTQSVSVMMTVERVEFHDVDPSAPKKDELFIYKAVYGVGLVRWYCHTTQTIQEATTTVPAAAMARLYQSPNHGNVIDDEWLKVPLAERIKQGLFGELLSDEIKIEQKGKQLQWTM